MKAPIIDTLNYVSSSVQMKSGLKSLANVTLSTAASYSMVNVM